MVVLDRAIATLLPWIPKAVIRHVASRYIAGETLQDAMRVCAGLNQRGFRATMDILGEDVHQIAQAETAAANYTNLLDEIHQRGMNSNISIKLTQLGLKIDPTECYRLTRSVVEHAAKAGNFVRIDMEDSSCTSATLQIHTQLRHEYRNVGVVLQAYLRRTADDAEALARRGENVRLCKGVYVEEESVAFQEMAEINANYVAVLRALLSSRVYVGIATHDEALIAAAEALIRELGLTVGDYEFQMLLGVREPLRDQILARGHPLRIYIPFGSDWYAYSLRRLRENPRLAGYVLRAMIRGR
jgi:proline dehydrogenase